MRLRSVLMATLTIAGVLRAFAFNFDVDIRVREARATGDVSSSKDWSPTKPAPSHDVNYPGTEEITPDEMRVIGCGSGTPMPHLKQAAICMLIELGNGDKFIFDMGTGSMERLYALGKKSSSLTCTRTIWATCQRSISMTLRTTASVPLRVWGPVGGGTRPEWGTKTAMDSMLEMWA